MALIVCSECQRQVSSQAAACPSCGAPVASRRDIDSVGVPLATVQQTSKRLKLQEMIGWTLVVVGVVTAALSKGSPGAPSSSSAIFGGIFLTIALVGSALVAITKLRIWWHHR